VGERLLVNKSVVLVYVTPVARNVSDDVIKGLLTSGGEQFQGSGGGYECAKLELRLDLVGW